MGDKNYKENILDKLNKYKKHILITILSLSVIGNMSAYPYIQSSNRKIQVANNKIQECKTKVDLSDSYKEQLQKLKVSNKELSNKNVELGKEKSKLQDTNNKLQESNKKLQDSNKNLEDKNKTLSQSLNKSKNNNEYGEASTTNNQSYTVCITDTGKKYHSSGCRYLKKSCYEISISDAKAQGYSPCSVCHP